MLCVIEVESSEQVSNVFVEESVLRVLYVHDCRIFDMLFYCSRPSNVEKRINLIYLTAGHSIYLGTI